MCRGNASCRPFLGDQDQSTSVSFNYTHMLLPGADAVQAACAAPAPDGGSNAVQSPATRAGIMCATMLDTCVNDAECRGCLQILKVTNAGRGDVPTFPNCSAAAVESLQTVFQKGACGAEAAGLQNPGACLMFGWGCSAAAGSGMRCLAELSEHAQSLDGGGSTAAPGSGDGSFLDGWNRALSTPACVALIQMVGDDHSGGDDDYDSADDDFTSAGDQSACAEALDKCSFPSGFECLYQARVCDADPTCRACLASTPTADIATVRYTPSCKIPIGPMKTTCQGNTATAGYVQYLSCSDKVDISNNIVYATSAFGALSLLSALSVLGVIYGHYKDRKSLRERILVGVFLGNALYSVANMIPVGLQKDGATSCGDPVSPALVSAVRALWFMGKYTMVCYEIFIIFASVLALRTGSVNMGRAKERAAHAGCLMVGLVVFTAFFAEGATLYETYTDTKGYKIQQQALTSYIALVETFVQVWLALLLLMTVGWIYQRFVLFRRLKTEWDAGMTEAEMDWDRDLWKRGDAYVESERERRRRLLEVIEEGYNQIVKPLEPYVATFILFAVPAVIMATDYCGALSEPDEAVSSVNCQHMCEMVLSLRTLATAGVYYSNPRALAQLWNVRQLSRRIWWRLRDAVAPATKARPGRGRRVRISEAGDKVQMIEDHAYADDDGPGGGGGGGGGNAGFIEG